MPPRRYAVPDRPAPHRDSDVLPEAVAVQVLKRASELDAARRAGLTVDDLRAAAAEAGISTPAFDAALAEVRGAGALRPTVGMEAQAPRPRRPWWALAAAALAIVATGAVAAWRTVAPGNEVVTSPVTVEVARTTEVVASDGPVMGERIPLRCLTPAEAADLAGPLLRGRGSRLQFSPGAPLPGSITVYGTPQQRRAVKATLARYEGDGASCATARGGA